MIWSNGGDRISKLDYETLNVIDELILSADPQTSEAADAEIATLDSLEGEALAQERLDLAIKYLSAGISGVYYLLSAENVLDAGGSESFLAYADIDPIDQKSKISLRAQWQRPEGIGGIFVTAKMTHDGWICTVTEEGWVILLKPDFSEYRAIQMVGSEVAPAHNAKMIAEGKRPGPASWVRN